MPRFSQMLHHAHCLGLLVGTLGLLGWGGQGAIAKSIEPNLTHWSGGDLEKDQPTSDATATPQQENIEDISATTQQFGLLAKPEKEQRTIPTVPFDDLFNFNTAPGQTLPTTLPITQIPETNQDRFLQPNLDLPEPLPRDPDQPPPPPEPAPAPPEPAPTNESEIFVETLSISGSSLFTTSDFDEAIVPLLGRFVSENELQQIADQVTEQYLAQGYITSRAVLNPESIGTGNIEILVLEGGIESIEIEGTQDLNPSYIRDRIALGTRPPLNTAHLEDQLRLLRNDPLIENIEASLRSGTEPAKSILVVRVTEARRLSGNVSLDNYSPPSVGSERMGANLNYQNLTGAGDSLGVGFRRTTRGGSDTLDFTYRYPLNAMDGTLQLRTSFNRNNVVQEPFNILDISGNSALYELSYRQPLVRNPRTEFALSTGLTYQTGQTFTFAGPTPFGLGPDSEGRTTTTVLKFGQDYLSRDTQGAWAVRSQFSLGLDVFNATRNPNPLPDGQFLSWLGQVQRAQILNTNNFLIFSTDLQYAFNPLLASQQFVIGGGQSVRGFRQNARAADNGLRFSVENRLTLARNEAGDAMVILAPFLDAGWVWNAQNNPNPLPRQRFIAGVGMGVIWQPDPKITVRLDYGFPLVNLEDRGQNAQDDGIYFSIGWRF
ncbi:ShlB/FhaC/HecB family hemolysin secretion/activation protein [Spirulina sp. CCNP1310]|uniref:ShlB/FhaC/HecB family hemolysin secretion/activation protein n=1 Tax=Spirulina sp. CCNP1310 TaxID=3110249 RepID=UPI002B21DB82|nr:ShlB/FhaC/HecB family hemolysin secretion/activation protein [Spirulina sp. CCNP1310]MEA5419461.1 ShlB/FhaC/HecB family hemolysin secretion/activation protein [Spirulina sp. CCNP1310]